MPWFVLTRWLGAVTHSQMRALWSAGRSGERRERRLVALIVAAELRGEAACACVCVRVCVCEIRAGLQQDFSTALS